MKNVVIKNLQGDVTHSAQFESLELAQAWVTEQENLMSWGKVSGTYPLSKLNPSELLTETSRQTLDSVSGMPLFEPLITIPAQFTVEITDISDQVALENSIKEGFKRQMLGTKILATVYAINQNKNLTLEQFDAILDDPTLAKIERLLKNGSLSRAKLLINSLDETFFSNSEKQQILVLLTDY